MAPGSSLLLPARLRGLLSQPPPRSRLARGPAGLARLRHRLVISIGDYVTRSLLAAGVKPWVAVFDCAERRSSSRCPSLPGYRVVETHNPRSTITWEAWLSLREAVSAGGVAVRVHGEEDLLALPAALLAPHGAYIVYGLPSRAAAVVVVADRGYKVFVYTLLQGFEEAPGRRRKAINVEPPGASRLPGQVRRGEV